MQKILFLEDDDQYRDALIFAFKKSGYTIDGASNTVDAMELFIKGKYNLVISDLNLTDVDGIQFLRYIKRLDETMKTMILTGNPTDDTELASLDISVDRYLIKGLRLDVLFKYVDMLLDEAKDVKSPKTIVLESEIENLRLDVYGRTITKNGELLHITPKEFELIKTLLMNKGKAMSREELLDEIWDGTNETVDPRVIDVHIKKIRKKLKLQSITSVRGFGYKWDE